MPTYVSYGVADVGVSGLDTLLEDDFDLLEPLDLALGRCRLTVAAPAARAHAGIGGPFVKVATKYPRLTRAFYRRRGVEPVVVTLSGSVELAAVAGLAERVVDLVDTGATLRANGLVEVETVVEVTSRLVVNPASMKTRHAAVDRFVRRLEAALLSSPPEVTA